MPGKRITANLKATIIEKFRQGHSVSFIVQYTSVSERSVIRILEAQGYDLNRKKRVRKPKVLPASQSGIVNPVKTEEVPVTAAAPVLSAPVADPVINDGLIPPQSDDVPVFTPPKEELPLYKLEQHEQPLSFPGTAPIPTDLIPPRRPLTLWERIKAYFGL